MTKLVWRLSKLPTVDELLSLVNNKLITQEEAKEILFNQETQGDRDQDSLKTEIKFLRELVEKLSQKSAQIIETIKYIETPYIKYPWYKPYDNWTYCNNGSSLTVTNKTTGTLNAVNCAFNQIETF